MSNPVNSDIDTSNQSRIVSNEFEPQILSRIAKLFTNFVKQEELQIDFFETQAGEKVDDYLDFLVLMYYKFSPTDAIDICQLYSNAINNITDHPAHRFVFLSHVIKFFGSKAILHLTSNIQNVLNLYYTLILEVPNDSSNTTEVVLSVFKYAVDSLIISMNNEVQIAIIVAGWIQQNTDQRWREQIPVDEPFLNFIKYIKWPLITDEDAATIIVVTILALLVHNEMDPKHELVITEAAVYQTLSLKGYPDQPILNYISELDKKGLKTSPNMRAIATFAFYSLLSNNTMIINSKSFATLVRLLNNGIEFSPALLICERFLQDIVQSGNSKESLHFNYLSLVLRSAVLNLPRLDPKDKEIITSILEIFYNVDHNETFKIINQFLREQKCPKDLLQVFINFAVDKDIDLQFFVPQEPSHTANFAKMLVVGARAAFTDHTFYNILLFLQACIKVLANPKIDFNETTEGKPKIPYFKIYRLCYYCLYIPNNPKVRLLAYDILKELGKVFQKENPNWKELEINEQALIKQIDYELKEFIKKDSQRIIKPRQLMTLEMERSKALNHVSRVISTTRIKFSARMLKESVELGEKMGCVYLFDMTACMINPILLYDAGKYAVQPLLLCTKLTKLNHFMPLQYLDFEYFDQIMERLLSLDCTLELIQALEAMTINAVNNINNIKPNNINDEITLLEKIIKENPTISNKMYMLYKTIDNISNQILNCQDITSFPSILLTCQKMCLDDIKIDHPEISDTLLSTILAQLRFETSLDTILNVLRLPSTYDSPMTPIFFSKLIQLYPDQFIDIMKSAYRILPDMISIILLENPIKDMNFFTLFCYFISDKTSPRINNALKMFIESQFPQISIEDVSTDKITNLFLKKIPGLADSMLKYSIEFYNGQEQLIQTHLKLLDILIPATKYISNPEELTEFGLKLTKNLLLTTKRFDDFWKSMTRTKALTKQVFDIIINNGIESYLVDYILELTAKKDAVIRYAQKLIFSELTKLISANQIKPLMTLYNIVTKSKELNAASLISTCVLLQMNPYETTEAYKYVKQILSPKELPTDRNQILLMLCKECQEDITVIFKAIKHLFGTCTTIEPIHYLFTIIFIYIPLYPDQISTALMNSKGDSPLINKAFIGILKTKEANTDDNIIDEYFGIFYHRLSNSIMKIDLPVSTLSYFLDIGFMFMDLNFKQFNRGFLEYILNLNKKNYFANAPPSQLNNLVMFELYGDEMIIEISKIFNKKIIEKVNDKVAKFWLNTILKGDEKFHNDENFFDSIKKAVVFGDKINLMLISRLLNKSLKKKEKLLPMITDLIIFLLKSKEVKKNNALNLVKMIEEKFGEFKNLENVATVKIFTKKLNDFEKYFSSSK